MAQKAVLLLLLVLSTFTLSCLAVPTARGLSPILENPSFKASESEAVPVDLGENAVLKELDWGDTDGRMLWETTDYPKTGANNRHEPPKTPNGS